MLKTAHDAEEFRGPGRAYLHLGREETSEAGYVVAD